MRILFLVLFFLISAKAEGYPAQAAEHKRHKITVVGSSTIAPLVLEIGKRFEKENPNFRIDVQTGGSSRGIIDTRKGLADIGMVSRDLKSAEADLIPYTIAVDGIGMIVHKDNPVESLNDQMIVSIYTKKINNWLEIGGLDLPITVVNKAEGRSTLELFLDYFSLDNREISPDIVIGDNQQGIKTISGNKGAIGYVSIGTAEFEEKRGTPIKLLPISGILASTDSVRDKTFPLSRRLNLVVNTAPSPQIKKFIDYARSNAVHDIIEAQFFVPLKNE